MRSFLAICVLISGVGPSYALAGTTVLGVRADKETNVVFVKCQLEKDAKTATACQDISISWPVSIFHSYLQGSLEEAKWNALYRAGLMAGLGGGSAFLTLRTIRSLQETGSLMADATTAIAEQGAFYNATAGPLTHTLEGVAVAAGVAMDVGRLLSLPLTAASALVCLSGAGYNMIRYIELGSAKSADDLVFDQLRGHNVFIFKNDDAAKTSVIDQEAEIQVLLSRLFQEVGA